MTAGPGHPPVAGKSHLVGDAGVVDHPLAANRGEPGHPAGDRPAAPLPPHAPEAGWGRRLLGRFHVTGVFWYKFHGGGVAVLPSWSMWVMVSLFTTFFFFTLGKIRHAVAGNLEAVLGRAGWLRRQGRIYKTLWSFAWSLTERYERLVTTRPFHVEAVPEGWARWKDLCDSGEGFILVTAHLGNWEVGSMLPAESLGRPVHVVREAEGDPRAQEYISELMRRQQHGTPHITHFAEDPQLGMLLLDALRRGEVVALQGDRPRAGGKTASLTLFGRPYLLPLGPAILARAAAVPLVPVFVFQEGRRRYCCDLRPPIQVPSTGDRNADLDQGLRRFAAELEQAIARRPHQWYCFRRLWP
jgi:KDO2-lipid IV(A) lauroyltransferase